MARSQIIVGLSWPWYSHAALFVVGIAVRVNENSWLRLSAKGEAAVIAWVSATMVKTMRITMSGAR